MSLTPRMQGRSAAEPLFYRVIGPRGVASQEAAPTSQVDDLKAWRSIELLTRIDPRVFRLNIVARSRGATLLMSLGLSRASPHQSHTPSRSLPMGVPEFRKSPG